MHSQTAMAISKTLLSCWLQIREMLCPSKPVTAHDSGGDDNWCDLSLDTLIDRLKGTQSPDGFGLSQLAKQASKIGAGQV
jgi:hypothetical protein